MSIKNQTLTPSNLPSWHVTIGLMKTLKQELCWENYGLHFKGFIGRIMMFNQVDWHRLSLGRRQDFHGW